MNRRDLQALARQRIRDARVLLRGGCPDGAYYLAGYAVECALKACIAKRYRRYDFPDRKVVNASWVHDLTQLVGVAGLAQQLADERKASPALDVTWKLVADWNEDRRYDLQVSARMAQDLYRAITAPRNGVLPWLRQYW